MNFDNFSVILRLLTLAQAVFVFTYLVIFRKRKLSLWLFGVFLLAYTLPNLSYVLNSFGLRETYPSIRFIPIGFYFACMPLFYLYTKSLLEKVTKKEILICIFPAIIDFIFYGVLFLIPYQAAIDFHNNYYNFLFAWYGVCLNIFSLFFVFLTIRKLNDFHKKYLQFFSNTQKINLKWISTISYLFIFVYAFQLSSLFFEIKDPRNVIYVIDSFVTAIVVYWISIFGINQSHIPSEYQIFVQSKMNLTNQDVQEFDKINQFIKNNKPFKNSNLTILDLSKELELPPKKLSQLINQFANKNFNQYINEFRVNEAKELLLSPDYHLLTIEAIYKDAGFNSKSVFNTVFKEFTGYTPSNFKKSVLHVA